MRTASPSRPRPGPCGLRPVAIASYTLWPVQPRKFPAPRFRSSRNRVGLTTFRSKLGKKETKLSTAAITVSVDAATGAVSFFSKDGKTVLAEPKEGGKSFDVPSVAEMKTWQVQQTFSFALR